jgi:polyribonucleotide nucleotidyltransferase
MRDIWCEVDYLCLALFTRGETQALQLLELLEKQTKLILHQNKVKNSTYYNFPSTGEARPLRGTSRRGRET